MNLIIAFYLGGLVASLPVILPIKQWWAILLLGLLWPLHLVLCLAGVNRVTTDVNP